MQIVLAGALSVVLAAVAGDVAAELYRWRDPQTGTIRYSSDPPPWYGDESREATAPKVEVLGNRDAEAAGRKPVDEMAEKVAEVIQFMEQRRGQLLTRMTVARASAGFDPAAPGFKADLQAYQALTRELDKFDPKGAAARRRADARVFENLGIAPQVEGARQAAGAAPQAESTRGVAPPPRPASPDTQRPELPDDRRPDDRR